MEENHELNVSDKKQPSLRSPEKLRVALIGGGFGRWFHLGGLDAQPELFSVRRFCDQNPKVVQQTLSDHPATLGCTDYQEVLNDPEIDAVIVSLPHHLHEPVCVAAAQKGKHILVDKPIARTLSEADRIIDAADKSGVTLMVAHNQRFEPKFQKIHSMLEEGAFGRPLHAQTDHHQNMNAPAGASWRSKSSVGGGCLIGSGIHALDLMRWFFGAPQEVFAYGVTDLNRLEGEVAVSASILFKNGVIVNFFCNWGLHGDRGGEHWAIYGTEGDVVVEPSGLRVGREFCKSVTTLDAGFKGPIKMWSHFADCIANHSLPLTNGRDARASLALVLKIYESIESGRPVAC